VTSLDRCYRIVQKPVITEKATGDQAERNTYHLQVPLSANKVEIRQAVERIFGVKVLSVTTSRVRGKARRRRWVAGRSRDWKRAMVRLREGQTIEIL
jgi:large subunit ribosomal protein L23